MCACVHVYIYVDDLNFAAKNFLEKLFGLQIFLHILDHV